MWQVPFSVVRWTPATWTRGNVRPNRSVLSVICLRQRFPENLFLLASLSHELTKYSWGSAYNEIWPFVLSLQLVRQYHVYIETDVMRVRTFLRCVARYIREPRGQTHNYFGSGQISWVRFLAPVRISWESKILFNSSQKFYSHELGSVLYLHRRSDVISNVVLRHFYLMIGCLVRHIPVTSLTHTWLSHDWQFSPFLMVRSPKIKVTKCSQSRQQSTIINNVTITKTRPSLS